MTVREVAPSVERHGIFKTKSGGVMHARRIELKNSHNYIDSPPDAA